MKRFGVADATIIGTSHRRLRYNSQDANVVLRAENIIAGVICDGSSSTAHSEVGAQLCARFVAHKCRELFSSSPFDVEQLCRATLHYLQQLTILNCADKIDEFVGDYLLSTIVGFVVKPDHTHLFWAGDGVIIVNDQLRIIDQDNRPRYLAYGLLGHEAGFDYRKVNTSAVDRLLIGSDGVEHFISNQGKTLGNGVSVLAIDELFEQEQFFSRPVALAKYLSDLEATESVLLDDTTMILLRSN